MEKKELEGVCSRRLSLWKERLVENWAIPIAVIAVGHEGRCGKLVVYTTEDMPDDMLEVFLLGAAEDLRKKH